VTIRVATGDCLKFGLAEVTRSRGALTLRVFDLTRIPAAADSACLLYLKAQKETVRLPQPLGNLALLGACTPGDATPEGRQCAAITGVARSAR
jgi:hypothetical protein